MTLDQYDVPE